MIENSQPVSLFICLVTVPNHLQGCSLGKDAKAATRTVLHSLVKI